jgi:hypothetical protein
LLVNKNRAVLYMAQVTEHPGDLWEALASGAKHRSCCFSFPYVPRPARPQGIKVYGVIYQTSDCNCHTNKKSPIPESIFGFNLRSIVKNAPLPGPLCN